MAGYDYDGIKALADRLRQTGDKQSRWSVEDLLALATKNDPFYVGQPAQRTAGEWFAQLWARFGFQPGAHLRRVHYVLVSQEPPVLLPDGKAYTNTKGAWNTLKEASKAARYLGLLPLDAMDGRRNPAPHIFAPASGGWSSRWIEPFTTYGHVGSLWMPPPMPTLDLPRYAVSGLVNQRYRVEIWVEKSTMNDVLVPLCRRHQVNLVTGLGEMSISAVRDLIRRIADGGKATRVLYISDFDPGGESMPRAVARKAEWLIRRDGIDVDFRLRLIVLTPEQIVQFNLPRTPIKESESRKASFEGRHGVEATELDALEALHPGALAEIVEREIMRYHDDTLERRLRDAEWPMWRALLPIQKEVCAEHEENIVALKDQYESIVAGIAERLEVWKARAEKVQEAIQDDLRKRMPKFERVQTPQPLIADEPEALFDSHRSYPEQLLAYKRYCNGSNGHDVFQGELRLQALTDACRANGLEEDAQPESGDDQLDDDQIDDDDE